MTLYEINQNIMSLIDEETGEITDIVAFEALLGAKEEKLENIIKLYKNATSDSTALKAEADAFTKRAKAAAALADRMKAMLEAELDGNTFECTTGKDSKEDVGTPSNTEAEKGLAMEDGKKGDFDIWNCK